LAAFRSAIQDPELIAEAAKSKMELEYIGGDETLKIVNEVLSQPKDIVDEFAKYIKFGE
jgi:hypothetical protein